MTMTDLKSAPKKEVYDAPAAVNSSPAERVISKIFPVPYTGSPEDFHDNRTETGSRDLSSSASREYIELLSCSSDILSDIKACLSSKERALFFCPCFPYNFGRVSPDRYIVYLFSFFWIPKNVNSTRGSFPRDSDVLSDQACHSHHLENSLSWTICFNSYIAILG